MVAWVTLLKTVPWGQVIANAPAITEGAKKLWNTVAKKPAAPSAAKPAVVVPVPSGTTLEAQVAQLRQQLATMDATVADLHAQMLASSELIKALADQHAELVARIEAHRRRLLWLSGAAAILAAAVAAQWLGVFSG